MINLSFPREDFLEKLDDCSENEICAIVCANKEKCAVVQDALAKIHRPDSGQGIRTGGAVVVAAVGRAVDTPCVSSPICYDPRR